MSLLKRRRSNDDADLNVTSLVDVTMTVLIMFILIAPVLEQGMVKRKVVLPEGKWRFCNGELFEGGQTVEVDAPIEVLPYFVRCN